MNEPQIQILDPQITDEHQILKQYQFFKETQITNEHQVLKEPKISIKNQI